MEMRAENGAFWQAYEKAAQSLSAPIPTGREDQAMGRFATLDDLQAKLGFFINRSDSVGVYLRPDAEADWVEIDGNRTEFELGVGRVLDWRPRRLIERSVLVRIDCDPLDESGWPALHRNLAYAAIRLRDTFAERRQNS